MIGTLAPEKRRNPEHNEESWSSRIVEAAERRLFQRSTCYLTRICSMQTDPHLHAQETAEQIRDLAPQASGAILFNVNHDSRAAVLETLDTQSLPWVSINRPNDHIHYNYVSCRNLCAGRIAGRCFAEQGLRHIVILSPPLHAAVGMLEKVLGVYQAFIQQGLPTQQIVCLTKGSYTEPEGYRMMRSYLEQADPMPQAVFATGDWLAMGAARACREFGLRIPQDISILGSTGLSICPDLSVITQPMEQMGQTAADMLLEMMQTGQQRISCQEIPGQFIDRGSVVLTESLRRFIQHEHTRIVEQAQAETLMTY